MNDYAKRCLVALPILAAAAFVSSSLIGATDEQHKRKRAPLVNVEMTRDDARAARRERYVWPGLEQKQVDALTAAVKGMKFEQGIVIFCADDSRCGDLALDFDNAFESAKLKSSIEKPFIDNTTGLGASSQELADVVKKTTGLDVTLLPPASANAGTPGPARLAIGKRI